MKRIEASSERVKGLPKAVEILHLASMIAFFPPGNSLGLRSTLTFGLRDFAIRERESQSRP
jgi:hypothetical protein